MTITEIIEGIIEREGGFVDHPDDKGGPTCWGITEAVARANGYQRAMRDLPRDFAARVYLNRYVVAPGFHQIFTIHSAIAEELVDTAVNCGPSLPGPWLQRILNLLNRQAKLFPDLVVDGQLGPATQNALQMLLRIRGNDGAKVILKTLNGKQVDHYMDITERRAANEEFFFGWILNRVEIA